MANFRGKSFKAIVRDVAEGYAVINPIFLKPFEASAIKTLYHEMLKHQTEVRGEHFPHDDIKAIRWRNLRLQRLNAAAMIIRNYAREKRIRIF